MYTLIMTTEVQKYKAQFLQIIGMVLMTPFGKLMLKLLDPDPFVVTLKFVIVFMISLFITFIGIIFVTRGIYHLEEE